MPKSGPTVLNMITVESEALCHEVRFDRVLAVVGLLLADHLLSLL